MVKYYFRKIFRYVPLNIVALLTVNCFLPYVGSGPIWNYYDQLVAGCGNYNWLTNVLWINNLYPKNYDDKCLPWTWFIPCYVQLSLIVPPIVYLYKKLNDNFKSGIIFFIIGILSILGNFLVSYHLNLGATISNINQLEFFS